MPRRKHFDSPLVTVQPRTSGQADTWRVLYEDVKRNTPEGKDSTRPNLRELTS